MNICNQQHGKTRVAAKIELQLQPEFAAAVAAHGVKALPEALLREIEDFGGQFSTTGIVPSEIIKEKQPLRIFSLVSKAEFYQRAANRLTAGNEGFAERCRENARNVAPDAFVFEYGIVTDEDYERVFEREAAFKKRLGDAEFNPVIRAVLSH